MLHYYFDPDLSINYTTGAAGSYFTVLGGRFPENTQIDITVNHILIGQVTSHPAELLK